MLFDGSSNSRARRVVELRMTDKQRRLINPALNGAARLLDDACDDRRRGRALRGNALEQVRSMRREEILILLEPADEAIDAFRRVDALEASQVAGQILR